MVVIKLRIPESTSSIRVPQRFSISCKSQPRAKDVIHNSSSKYLLPHCKSTTMAPRKRNPIPTLCHVTATFQAATYVSASRTVHLVDLQRLAVDFSDTKIVDTEILVFRVSNTTASASTPSLSFSGSHSSERSSCRKVCVGLDSATSEFSGIKGTVPCFTVFSFSMYT